MVQKQENSIGQTGTTAVHSSHPEVVPKAQRRIFTAGEEQYRLVVNSTAEFLPLIEKKQNYCRHEVRYLAKTGGYRWMEAHARRIENEAGDILGISGLLRDVTERKQREPELECFATVTRALRQANTRTPMLPIILDQALDLLQAGSAMFVIHPVKNRKQIELACGEWQQLSGQWLLPGYCA